MAILCTAGCSGKDAATQAQGENTGTAAASLSAGNSSKAAKGKSPEGRPGGSKGGRQNQAPVPVLAADTIRKTVPVQLKAIGTVEAYSTVIIKAQIGGVLTGVHFKEGQDIKKGDLLFTIDPRSYEATLHREEANLARDTVGAKKANIDFQRYAELYKKGTVSKDDYDRFRTVDESMNAQVAADRAAVESARLQVEYCTIRSPLDGRAGSLMTNEGNLVKANDTSLVAINQICPIYVSFTVPERDLPTIKGYLKEGKKLTVEVAPSGDEDRPTTGELSFVDNEVNRDTGTIRLKATFSNEDKRLWPGQFVNVTLTLTTRPDAILVPAQAIQTGQDGQYVYVIKTDNTVESRPVTSGMQVDGEVVVEKGLEAGEKVVTDGQLRLTPGAKVEIKTGLGASGAKGTAS